MDGTEIVAKRRCIVLSSIQSGNSNTVYKMSIFLIPLLAFNQFLSLDKFPF